MTRLFSCSPGAWALYAVSVRRLIALHSGLPLPLVALACGSPYALLQPFRPFLTETPLPSANTFVKMFNTLTGFTYRGLPPHKFTPMPGVHKSVEIRRANAGAFPAFQLQSWAESEKTTVPSKKNIKIFLGLIGIVLAIIGWLFGNLSYIPSLRNFLLPKCEISLLTLEKMNKEGFVLKKDDLGFTEIASLLRKDVKTMIMEEGKSMPTNFDALKKLPDWKINRFETVKSEVGMGPNDKVTRRLTLRISSENATTIDLPFADMKSWLERNYCDEIVFKLGMYVFWAGIIISIIGVFL
jgi:hypothetical protein